jgi:hypothetical protein
MWFKTVGAVSLVVLYGVALGQTRSDPSTNTSRYYIPIWGRVVDYTGAPVRHRTMTLSGTGREGITTEIDDDGKFRFPTVEGGKPAALGVNAPGFASTPIDIGVLTRGGDIGTVVLQPDQPSALGNGPRTTGTTQSLLSGRITNVDGSPYAVRVVNFRDLKRVKPYQPESVAICTLATDRSGVFVFPAASGHEYQVYVPESQTPLTFKALANVEIAADGDVDLGNIAMHIRPDKEAVAELLGPVKLSDSAATTSSLTSAQIAAVFVGTGGIVSIVHGDGKILNQPKEKEQVGCSSPLISDDRQAVGWLVDSDFCCTSYPLQFMVVVYRPGQPLRRFKGDGRAIFGWSFVGGSKQIAFFQSFPHGDPVTHYELRDVATERLVGAWDGDVTSKTPRWVRAFGN